MSWTISDGSVVKSLSERSNSVTLSLAACSIICSSSSLVILGFTEMMPDNELLLGRAAEKFR